MKKKLFILCIGGREGISFFSGEGRIQKKKRKKTQFEGCGKPEVRKKIIARNLTPNVEACRTRRNVYLSPLTSIDP